MRGRALTTGITLAALAAAWGARGAEATPIHLEVESEGGCLDPATFEQALFARIRRPRGDGRTTDAQVRVTMARDGAAFLGHVVVVEPGDRARTRSVRGPTCEEVARSLVLVAALALGGDAAPEAPQDAGPRPAEAAAPAPFDPDDRPPFERPSPRPPPPRPASVFAVGAHGGLLAMGGGGLSGAGDAFAEWRRDRPGLAPGLRLGAALSWTESPLGPAAVDVMVATVRLDPSLLQLGEGSLSVRAGLTLELGAARAAARGPVRDAQASTRPWVGIGVAARAAARIAGPLSFELEGCVVAPLVRDEFVIRSALGSYVPPTLVPAARAGLELTWR